MANVEDKRRNALRGRGQKRDVLGRLLLTAQEAKLLNCLLCHQGQIVKHRDLIDWLWGDDPDGGPLDPHNVITVRICWLRFLGWPVDSVWGRGYMIRWADQPAPQKVQEIRPVEGRARCIASMVLDALLAKPSQWVASNRIALDVYRDDPYAHVYVRKSVGVCVHRLRRHGWKIEGRYGKGYRIDPSVIGTRPNPRMAGDGWRYTNRHAA